ARLLEPRFELPARAVTGRQRPRRAGESVGSPQLACEEARRLSVEPAPHQKLCPHHDARGENAPRFAVELDFDLAALALSKRGDCPSHSSPLPAAESAVAAASASAATSALPLELP